MALKTDERLAHCLGGAVAPFRHHRHGFFYDCQKIAEVRIRSVGLGAGGGAGLFRRTPCGYAPKCTPKAEDVALRRPVVLRRHVAGRPDNRGRLADVHDESGVRDDRPSINEEDVAWLDIPVQEMVALEMFEGGGETYAN